jgi:FAD/FMN-containing dehydrogenase
MANPIDRARLAAALDLRLVVPALGAVDMGILSPVSSREAAQAQRARGELDAEQAGAVSISVSLLDFIAGLEPASATVRVGAGARVASVESALQEKSLSLGGLTPGTLGATVGEWLAGPAAGLRVIPGNRLETAAMALEVALRGGGLFASHPAPRSAAGPGLEAAFLGAGAEAGLIVGATLRALPHHGERAWVHASFPGAEGFSAGLRVLLQRDVPVVEAQIDPRGGTPEVDFLLCGPAFRAVRDRAAVEEWVTREGTRRTVSAVGNRAHSHETEISWADLPAVIGRGAPIALFRLSRESLVVATGERISEGRSLAGTPEALPAGFLEALDASREVA